MAFGICFVAAITATPVGVAQAGQPEPGSALNEFKVKREQVFEFAEKPRVQLVDGRYQIRFASKANCDVTVAIENATGKIIRHLASGVLGDNAPPPLEKGRRDQTITWDGKNDQGVLIDPTELSGLAVRVSLGLSPRFERTMFWQPKRRPGVPPPLVAPAPEGVYVFQGGAALDSLILYDRDGKYLRTVYPLPGDRIGQAQGLKWITYPQDGRKLPVKTNYLQCTMLTSGTNATGVPMLDPKTGEQVKDPKTGYGVDLVPFATCHFGMYGTGATCLAVRDNRIALANMYINRLGADGTTAGMQLLGPRVNIPAVGGETDYGSGSPNSIALSPDGKWLYLTGFIFARIQKATQDIQKLADCRSIPVVLRASMDNNDPPTVFAGKLDVNQAGSDNEHFKVPTSVVVDPAGRVYVGDYLNDRVQVFDPAGKWLKTIPAYRPAGLALHQKTGELYVFSWLVHNQYEDKQVRRQLVRFGPFDQPDKLETVELASQSHFAVDWGNSSPFEFAAAVDSYSDPVRVWLAEPWGFNILSMGGSERRSRDSVQILQLKDGKLEKIRDFGQDVAESGLPLEMAKYFRQRLYVNPTNGRVYVGEGDESAEGKSFSRLLELDPTTGGMRPLALPFDAEDMCFDLDGVAYLRSIDNVGRYDPSTWREIPWDYGEERTRVAYGWNSSTKTASLVSVLVVPADGNWHHGGMFVAPNGDLLVACGYNVTMSVRTNAKYVHTGKKYEPKVYPGRLMTGRGGMVCLHVFDRHGQLVHEDAVPGLGDLYGLGLDSRGGVYFMTAATRLLDGQPYLNRWAGTVAKFQIGQGRVVSVGRGVPVPLSPDNEPKRPFDLVSAEQGGAWAENPEWFYGGVGFGGKNTNGCACCNSRYAFDYFNRSFAPELERYGVAVLDANGNLILRIGQYGNVDDGQPIEPAGGPAHPRSIGGDEVALFHGAYLATDTDHRLFIADPGNGRILSVRLDYAASERITLKEGPNRGN